jgi:hypothetical protein
VPRGLGSLRRRAGEALAARLAKKVHSRLDAAVRRRRATLAADPAQPAWLGRSVQQARVMYDARPVLRLTPWN